MSLRIAFILAFLPPFVTQADLLHRLTINGVVSAFSSSASFRIEDDVLIPERGFFSFFPDGSEPLYPAIEHDESGQPGDPVPIYLVLDGRNLSLVAELRFRDEVVSSSQGFLFTRERGTAAWVALIGIPNTVEEGEYVLRVAGVDGERSFLSLREFTVQPKEFETQEVRLSQSLTDLRRAPNQRRVEESRTMWRILEDFDPKGVHDLGRFQFPLEGASRTSGFGDRRTYQYFDGVEVSAIHYGVDFGAPTGTVILAAASGRVVMARARIVSGLTVVIQHLPGVFSLYYHLSSVRISEGDHVRSGDVLGAVGSTGLATGPHLHWEVRISTVAIDPDILVREEMIDTQRITRIIERYPKGGDYDSTR